MIRLLLAIALIALAHHTPSAWWLLLAAAGFGLLALRCFLGLLGAVADLIARR